MGSNPTTPTTTIGRIHAMGGTLDVPGNVIVGATTPTDYVEWNFGADPDSVASVLATGVSVSLVPLDATQYVPVSPETATSLGADDTAAGADILYKLLQNNPFMTSGDWYIWDPLAALTLTSPGLVTWSDMSIGSTTTGAAAGRIFRLDGGRPATIATAAQLSSRPSSARPRPSLATRWSMTSRLDCWSQSGRWSLVPCSRSQSWFS